MFITVLCEFIFFTILYPEKQLSSKLKQSGWLIFYIFNFYLSWDEQSMESWDWTEQADPAKSVQYLLVDSADMSWQNIAREQCEITEV